MRRQAATGGALSRLIARVHAALLGPADRRDPLGREGEAEAWRYLRKRRYRLLGRNLRVPMGEADLLCRDPDGETVVLVEVKSRRVAEGVRPFAAPEASVHAHKRRKLASIARHLARANGWTKLRIDVVAVEFGPTPPPVVRHWIGAVKLGAPRRQ